MGMGNLSKLGIGFSTLHLWIPNNRVGKKIGLDSIKIFPNFYTYLMGIAGENYLKPNPKRA
jgi:hypothetical protein